MTRSQTPGVVFQPKAYQGLQRGINQMVAAIRPALGPLPRLVAIGSNSTGHMPELLDNGAMTTRRIVELSDRDADMGAMFTRHVLWQVYEKVGDGTATTALLFQTVYNEGVHYSVVGGNPMQVRRAGRGHFLKLFAVVGFNELSAKFGQHSGGQQEKPGCSFPLFSHRNYTYHLYFLK